jgi:hypothetical protein
MEIGKPMRIHVVEPIQAPVPSKRRPQEAPERRVKEQPSPAPAK